MTNTIEPFGQYFSILKEKEDKTLETIELIPNGNNTEVTESNKLFFVKRMYVGFNSESTTCARNQLRSISLL